MRSASEERSGPSSLPRPVRPRVLVLHGNGEDYLADSLLHGLRTVLGEACVDAPRRDALYADFADERRRALYGRGFTLYGRLDPSVDIDRSWPLQRAILGHFELVVVADVHRNWAPWVWLRAHLGELRAAGVRVAVLDGGDGDVLYPHGPPWWRRARPWPLPRAHGRVATFKRELTPRGAWIRYGGVVPPRIAERLLARHVRPISFSIPEEHVTTGREERTQLLATHVVDPEVAALVPGSAERYVFQNEEDYRADLRASRFAITTKKAGWDTLRHYEVAAGGAIPCVRDLERKPPRCAPHGLNADNCVAYTDARALLERLHAIQPDEEARLRAGTLAWARHNTTRARAESFLAELGLIT
jgi:hypothetical protein